MMTLHILRKRSGLLLLIKQYCPSKEKRTLRFKKKEKRLFVTR
jgi:tRNA U34 5-carboxymethylaminomethyl modifying enzyme MnmG/GidA